MRHYLDSISENDFYNFSDEDYEPLVDDDDDPNTECPECHAPAGELCHWDCDYLERTKR